MYLSRLEIIGFKSFANKTVVDLSKGITGIVGPNGCGKTNIVDAIRWCLGEQKSSTLRSDKMENVIFNGTKTKKPMGMSEVSMTIINDRGILPSDYTEITITRRIFRSGESEYLLNKNICRLKDITNLFMDTGMGTNAYSVIELKMIETILSNKADERRHMFEEAAGVNKYKLRRRLSLKKLDDVKSDLTRVNDIISEVDKNVRSLERQAKRADKYNQFQTMLRELELSFSEREFSLISQNLKDLSNNISELTGQRTDVDKNIKDIEDNLISLRKSISDVESELSEKRKEIYQQNELVHDVQKNISVNEERSKSLSSNLDAYKIEIEELKVQDDENDYLIESKLDDIEVHKSTLTNKEKDISEGELKLNDIRNIHETKKNLLKQKNDDFLVAHRELNIIENSIKSSDEKLKSTHFNIDSSNEKISNITGVIAKTVGYLEELGEEKEQAIARISENEKALELKSKEKKKLKKELSDLKEKELEKKGAVNNLENKIDLYTSLITNLEGISKGSKILISNNEWTKKDKTIIADVGNADENYRLALEAALKDVLNNLLVESVEEIKSAVEYLKKNKLGKASFYLLQNGNESKNSVLNKFQAFTFNRRIKRMTSKKAFINWAYNLVQTNSKWDPYFTKLLSRTAVVKSLDDAFKFFKQYPELTFVTLDGDLVSGNGIIEAGSLPGMDETIFGRKQLLENLKNELPSLENELQKFSDEILDKERLIESINLKEIEDQLKLFNNEVVSIDKQISQLEYEHNKSKEDVEKVSDLITSLAKETKKIEESLTKLNEDREIKNKNRLSLEQELHESEDELKSIEDELNLISSNHTQKKLEYERIIGQINKLENEVENATSSKLKIKTTIEKRENDIEKTNEQISSIKIMLEDAQIEFDEVKIGKEDLASKEKDIAENLQSLKSEASVYESDVNKMRSNRQDLSEKIHKYDIDVNKYSMQIEQLANHILEEYSLELEHKEFDDLESYDFPNTRIEIQKLKEKIKNLGPINLLAYSEFEEEKERLEFLDGQRQDLYDSEKELIQTISEINETARDKFLETFDSIRENFTKIFRTLFDPGDEAYLTLENEVDPLESKIEIVAKPKGKRPTSIELLSGGEKTLTATALLFAIYLVKPSPFCILDEVDAPLDDSNVYRFTKLLTEFSSSTQFIIVTHNKGTMEAAENMYGVTMQEEGISKLVGVRFNEEISVN